MSQEELKNIVDVNFPKGKKITLQDVHQLAQVIYAKAQDDVIEVIRRLDGKDVELGIKPAKVEGRRVGNTTRIADWYIQYIFNKMPDRKNRVNHGGFMVYDHGQSCKLDSPENKHLIKIIQQRLLREHGVVADYDFGAGSIILRKK